MKFLTGSLIALVFVVAFTAMAPARAGDDKQRAQHGGISYYNPYYNPYYPVFSGYYGLRHSRIQFGHHAGHLASRIARDPLGRYSSYYPYGGGFYGGYSRGTIDYRDLASTPYYRDPRPSYSAAPRYSSEPYASRRSTYFSSGGRPAYQRRSPGAAVHYDSSRYTATIDENYHPDKNYAQQPAALLDGCERVSKWGRDDYGKRARIGGTLCYDDYDESYIVKGSRFVIGYR